MVPSINLAPVTGNPPLQNPQSQQLTKETERKERDPANAIDEGSFQKPVDKTAQGNSQVTLLNSQKDDFVVTNQRISLNRTTEELQRNVTNTVNSATKNQNILNSQTIVKSQEIEIKGELIKSKILSQQTANAFEDSKLKNEGAAPNTLENQKSSAKLVKASGSGASQNAVL